MDLVLLIHLQLSLITPYLFFFVRVGGFRCLILAGLCAGRSLKRFSLARGNCMVDPRLLTITSSLPPISTKLKRIQELQSSTKPPSFIQSWWLNSVWVCCKSVRCSSFSVWWQEVMLWSLYRGTGHDWRVCELSGAGAGMWEGPKALRTSTQSFTPVPSLVATHPACMPDGHQLPLWFKQEFNTCCTSTHHLTHWLRHFNDLLCAEWV